MNNIPNIPQEKQITYFLDLSIKYPFELYINDIKADFSPNGGNPAVDINPYVLKNGKYKIKLKIFPYNEETLKPEDIEKNNIILGKYIINKETDKVIEYDLYQILPLNKLESPVPFFEQEWEVELTELPYELEGWSKGQDLAKMDKKVLEDKVVKYYKELWQILNNGDAEEYHKKWETADKELFYYNYETSSTYEEAMSRNNKVIEEKCKGMMASFEDYEVKIYGKGKLVALERKSHTESFNNEKWMDIKGWSPLIRKYKISGGANYSILLYLPEGSDEFVIIRK